MPVLPVIVDIEHIHVCREIEEAVHSAGCFARLEGADTAGRQGLENGARGNSKTIRMAPSYDYCLII